MKTQLEAVAKGASYNYTFENVLRVDGPFFERVDLAEYGGRVIVFMEEGETQHTEQRQGGVYLSEMEVFVDAMARYKPDSPNPLRQTSEVRSTIRSKLLADMVRGIMTDDQLGGNATWGCRITDDAPVSQDIITSEEWVGIEARFVVKYELDESSP